MTGNGLRGEESLLRWACALLIRIHRRLPPPTHSMTTAAHPVSAPVAALLEIGRDSNGNIPQALISAAYWASRSRPVMLVLAQVSPREVDAVLDPIVTRSYRDHRGVIYADAADERTVLAGAAAASQVFAASSDFMAKLMLWGIPFEDVSRAEPLLADAS